MTIEYAEICKNTPYETLIPLEVTVFDLHWLAVLSKIREKLGSGWVGVSNPSSDFFGVFFMLFFLQWVGFFSDLTRPLSNDLTHTKINFIFYNYVVKEKYQLQ